MAAARQTLKLTHLKDGQRRVQATFRPAYHLLPLTRHCMLRGISLLYSTVLCLCTVATDSPGFQRSISPCNENLRIHENGSLFQRMMVTSRAPRRGAAQGTLRSLPPTRSRPHIRSMERTNERTNESSTFSGIAERGTYILELTSHAVHHSTVVRILKSTQNHSPFFAKPRQRRRYLHQSASVVEFLESERAHSQ